MNKKLLALASFVESCDIVIDMACDHAYLAIYLAKNNLAKKVYASDISKNALQNAKNNITKAKLDIPLYLSDGFKNIPALNLNCAIISGVGTKTIMNIINDSPKNITKYIISTNNNYYELRKFMLDNHFYLSKEIVIEEHHKYYPIMLFTKEYHKLTKISLKYGLSNNQEYFKYLLTKEKEIIANIPKYKLFTYLKHYQEIVILTKLIKEKN